MKTREHKIDALTAAYVAIGAARALDAARATEQGRNGVARALDGLGETGFIDVVVDYARYVDEAWHARGDDGRYDGVFDYDVSEEFGVWLAREAMAGRAVSEELARAKVMELMQPGLIPDEDDDVPAEGQEETLVSSDCGCGMFDCCVRCAP